MNLVKIEHERCGEWSATTFVLVPDEWDEEMIGQRVRAAQDAYLAAVALAKETGAEKQPDLPSAHLSKYPPEMTIEAAMREYKRRSDEVAHWQRNRRETIKSFAEFLADEGFVSLHHVDGRTDGVVQVDLDWGHRHGTRLTYEDTETDTLPRPRGMAGFKPPESPFGFGT